MTAKHNGGDTPLDRLRAVGNVLYGEKWRAAIGDALGVSRITVSAWDNGRWDVPDDLDERLLAVLQREHAARHRALRDVEIEIKRFEKLLAGRR